MFHTPHQVCIHLKNHSVWQAAEYETNETILNLSYYILFMPYLHIKDRDHITKQLYAIKPLLKTQFQGSAVAPFIGSVGYPHIRIGILSPAQQHPDAWKHDAPRYWGLEQYSSQNIINLRAALINSRLIAHIKSKPSMLSLIQEVSMASKPADVEITLKKIPQLSFLSYQYNAPHGPKAELNHARITSNPHVPAAIEKIVYDTDCKTTEALTYLYTKGYDETMLTRLLSVGNIGTTINRKLVPTRWSITATDDIISKHLITKLQDYPEASYATYFGGYLGNYFLIITFPGPWSYELFEITTGTTPITYSTDHEFIYGRSSYASETVGGYYACRTAITQHLNTIRKSARVLAFLFITPEYKTPLGVWVVREATRATLCTKPTYLSSITEAINIAGTYAAQFGVDLNYILKHSALLSDIKNQQSLLAFFTTHL